MAKSKTTSKSNWGAPTPGSYAPPPAEKAQHRSEAIADSAAPGGRSFKDTLRSAQPGSKYPPEASSSDNAYARSLIASDTTTTQRKPDLMK
jgi:hypothetical protein